MIHRLPYTFAATLKPLIVILLMTGMLAQTFSRLFIIIDYQLNKDYLAANLCENRDKPQMHCNGKCCMMKKMKQEEKNDQENPERKMENKFEIIAYQATNYLLTPGCTIITRTKYPVIRESISPNFHYTIFHPPRA